MLILLYFGFQVRMYASFCDRRAADAAAGVLFAVKASGGRLSVSGTMFFLGVRYTAMVLNWQRFVRRVFYILAGEIRWGVV